MMSMALTAAEISQQQAMDNARSFMLQKKGGRTAAARARKTINMQPAETGVPEIYAFNTEGGGYVIASADDRTLPVLGYSLTGSFDASRIPDNMRAWLQDYAEQIRMMGNTLAATATASDNTGLAAIEPLIQTRWGQYAPYNLLTPVANGTHTVTGCVATAMAQVMYYHQWPKEKVEVQELPATTFEWDKMLPAYTTDNPGTEEQRQAVATLMRYCGQAARMNYGEASSTNVMYAVKALRDEFNYSKSVRAAFQYDYSLSGWRKLIWEELNHKRPVIMSGAANTSAHAFVIDGYDGSGMFHVNWGYDGSYDDYFAINVMNPRYPAHSASTNPKAGYVKYQTIIIGVEPSTGSEEVVPLTTRFVKMLEAPDTYWDKFATTIFYFDADAKPGHFEFALGTKDADGNATIRLVSKYKSYIQSGKADVLEIDIDMLDLPDGSYKLYPYYRDLDVDGDSWHQIGGDREYWGVNVKGKRVTFFFDQKLKITKACLEGDEQAPLDKCSLVVEVENEGDNVVYLPKSALLYGQPEGKKFIETYNPANGDGTLELQPQEKTTLRYPFTVPFQGDIELRLCRTEAGSPLATTILTVDKEPHYYDIELTDYKVVYKADENDMKKAVVCTLSLKNNDTRPLNFRLYSRIGNDGRENGDYNKVLYSSEKLSPGQTKEVKAYLGDDLEAIKEPTDLHLVVMMGYNDFLLVKLLDLNIKPGTTVTQEDATAIGTIDAPDATDAPYYDLQGRRVSRPQKGVYIRNGKIIVREREP